MSETGAGFAKQAFLNLPAEKRERILRAAVEEFAEGGYENTSIQQIAAKAGISVGAVYKYFEDKEALFACVVQEGLGVLEQTLQALAATEEDIALKAETILRDLLAFSRENPELIRLYHVLTTSGNRDVLRQFSQRIEALSASVYRDTIAAGQKTGDVRKDVDPSFFAFLLDNIFMMLQFSTACDYYRERFTIYTGRQPEDCDDWIVAQTLMFLKAAFNFK